MQFSSKYYVFSLKINQLNWFNRFSLSYFKKLVNGIGFGSFMIKMTVLVYIKSNESPTRSHLLCAVITTRYGIISPPNSYSLIIPKRVKIVAHNEWLSVRDSFDFMHTSTIVFIVKIPNPILGLILIANIIEFQPCVHSIHFIDVNVNLSLSNNEICNKTT